MLFIFLLCVHLDPNEKGIQLILQENNNNGNSSLMLLIALGYGLNSFGLVFITCEFSQRGCDAVNSFDFEIGQIDWYLCPIEMKKMLPTIMNMAQKPVAIKGFGTMAADREIFKKVRYIFQMLRVSFKKNFDKMRICFFF